MKPIKISVFGADGNTCQIPRIKEGLIGLGHMLSNESPDLIYSNDPTGYEKAMMLKKKFPKSFLILNFLDIPWHLPKIQEQTNSLVKYFLNKADEVLFPCPDPIIIEYIFLIADENSTPLTSVEYSVL